jgi:hypothetical protein
MERDTVDLGCSALLIFYEEGCNDWPDIMSASFDSLEDKG